MRLDRQATAAWLGGKLSSWPVLPLGVGKRVPAPSGASEGPVILNTFLRMFNPSLGIWDGSGARAGTRLV